MTARLVLELVAWLVLGPLYARQEWRRGASRRRP